MLAKVSNETCLRMESPFHIHIGHDALGVELERIEDEGTAQEVIPDHHAALSQSSFLDIWQGNLECASRPRDTPWSGEGEGDPLSRGGEAPALIARWRRSS